MTTITLPEEVFNLYQEVLIKTLNEGILTGANADLIRVALDAEPTQQVIIPEGHRLIAVDATFDDLMYWLERCERKGHLENCPDLIEPWEKFKYLEI